MALADTARLAVRIDLEGNAASGVQKLNRQVGNLQGSVGRVGKGFGQIAGGLSKAGLLVGGAAVTALTGAAKAAIDFEDAFAGVRKTVNEADLTKAGMTFEGLALDFREMATEIPIAATEFARLGEIAGALGVKATDIQEFTRVTALMGVTTNLSADEAADAFGRIGTILNLTGDDYTELADSIVAVGNAGASTEAEIAEITKRFAAQAVQLGLNKEQMVGLASATASLGFGPERGGTALARVFANLSTNIALANSKGKTLASGLGRSIGDLQRDIDNGKGLDIFLDVLEEIKTMSPTAAARFLKDIGVTNTSDRTIFQSMSKELPFVNEQLEIARKSQGALLAEAEKKFATTASKIQLFKNNVIEAGIAVGTEMLPAVGRGIDKIIAVLKDPGTKSDLTQLGKDVAAAIDAIDWKEVVNGAKTFLDVMKTTLGITLRMLDALNGLPTEIKAAGLAFLAANKLSGGLLASGVGNVVGGLAGAAAVGLGSRLPGVGRLFAQPVFVTNWPLGGLGGGGLPGAAAGIGAGTLIAGAALTALAAAAVIAVQQSISNRSTAQAADIQTNLNSDINGKTDAELVYALSGINQGIADIQSNPLNVLVQGEALTTLQNMRADIIAQLKTPKNELGGQSKQNFDPDTRQWRNDNKEQTARLAAIREEQVRTATEIARTGGNTTSSVDDARARITAAQAKTDSAVYRGATTTSAATSRVAPPIVGAIRANRPITNVSVNVSTTSVTKVTVTNNRYGPPQGSAGSHPGSGLA
jgi:TP901 family phage tail tape measure protein